MRLVYSTRTGGAPITWFKRMLLRMMRQARNRGRLPIRTRRH